MGVVRFVVVVAALVCGNMDVAADRPPELHELSDRLATSKAALATGSADVSIELRHPQRTVVVVGSVVWANECVYADLLEHVDSFGSKPPYKTRKNFQWIVTPKEIIRYDKAGECGRTSRDVGSVWQSHLQGLLVPDAWFSDPRSLKRPGIPQLLKLDRANITTVTGRRDPKRPEHLTIHRESLVKRPDGAQGQSEMTFVVDTDAGTPLESVTLKSPAAVGEAIKCQSVEYQWGRDPFGVWFPESYLAKDSVEGEPMSSSTTVSVQLSNYTSQPQVPPDRFSIESLNLPAGVRLTEVTREGTKTVTTGIRDRDAR